MKSKFAVATCVVAAAAVLGACGSDSGGGSSGGSSSSSTTLKSTVSGEPIVVGTICSCSGAQSAVLAKVSEGNKAWAASVNAAGGINGHPVKLIVKDDGGDPAKGLAAAKELVGADKVMAIVGSTSLTTAVWAKTVDAAGVPVVGGIPGEAPFASDPDFFPSGSSIPIAIFGQLSEAKAAGKKKFGVLYCAESPICAQLEPITKALAGIVGIDTFTAKVSATAPNYTAPCLALKDAGVDALYVAHNSTVVDRVVNGCVQQTYKPLNVVSSTTVGSDSLKNPNFEGADVVSSTAFYTDTSIPAIQDFQDAVFAFDPKLKDTPLFNTNTLSAWAGGKLFEAAAAKAKLSPTSAPADVKKGLYALKDETLGGIAPPLNFVADKPAFPACYFVASVADGGFAPKSSDPTCLDQQQLGAVAGALGA